MTLDNKETVMNILETIAVTNQTANVLYEYSTFKWNKKHIISFVVSTTLFICATAIINRIGKDVK